MGALLYVFAAIAGALNAVQAGANSSLAKALDNRFAAALTIVSVSFAGFLVVGTVSRQLAWPGLARFAAAPWWTWVGGLLGGCFVLAQLFAAEKLGSAVFMTITVSAAVIMALLLDHFGLVGFKQHSLGWGRAAGALLILGGLGLIARF